MRLRSLAGLVAALLVLGTLSACTGCSGGGSGSGSGGMCKGTLFKF